MSQVPVASAPVRTDPGPPPGPRVPNRWLIVGVVAVLVMVSIWLAAIVTARPGAPAEGERSVKGQPFLGTVDPGPVRLKITPANGKRGVRLGTPVVVRADAGTLSTVEVTADGVAVDGHFDRRAHRWTADDGLIPAASYKIAVTAKDLAGKPTTVTSTFTTMEPERELRASIMPLDGETVGVGMPIGVFFNHPVQDRAAVERRLEVDTSSNVEGAWNWFSDTDVRWRPKEYWPAGERVGLKVKLTGVPAGNGVWGVADRVIHFQIGDSHISKVSVGAHTMVVTSNGRVIRTMPASTGRDRYPTTNGIHTVLGKQASRIMDSSTVPGIPADQAYRLKVLWATRISNSGEFVHAAPWSVGAQGRANVSHGCVNLSTANAQWFYSFSLRGDIVQVSGSPRRPGESEGVREWNRSWAQWRAGSALA